MHMLRVRFGGFSVPKITKGLKATLIDKVAHFGGTAGLFTGVSYIVLFEILNSVLSFIIPCQSKENQVKDVEFQSKECENQIEGLEKKVDYNTLVDAMDNLKKRLDAMDNLTKRLDAMDILTKKVDAIDNLTKKVDAMDNLTKKLDSKLDVVMERLLGEK